jgi:putative peptidoglycan lipid II flippase
VTENQKAKRSIASIAGVVAIATLISKVFGLVRQMAIAAAFGVGVTAEAYNYAYMIPGFLLILLGGINGPFHSAIVSVLAKQQDKSDTAPLVETITTMVGAILLVVSIIVILFAGNVIDFIAPGLSQPEAGVDPARGLLVRQSAIEQLQIMSFMAVLAGFIGIGFGTLSAADMYWLPSISPILSSVTIIGGVGLLYVFLGSQIVLPQYALLGGKVLAWGTLLGALLQWLVQVVTQWRAGMGTLRLRFDWWRPGVKDVWNVMGPATISSSTLQINLYIDLFFASFIPSAAAAMQYSGLLIQTPLGIISNVILAPLLPIFARLADPQDWDELKDRIRQGLMLTGITMMPLSAIMIALSLPIVRVVYERGAFGAEDSRLVSAVLIAASLGMFVFLGRDILVRVFYALGDGGTPFKISVVNIFFNFLFDYLLYKPLGAPGITLSTVCINIISFVALSCFLHRRLHGLPWRRIVPPLLGLLAASIVTGLATWSASYGCQQLFPYTNLLTLVLQVVVSGGVGLLIFAAIASQLKLPELDLFVSRLRQKFLKK